MQVSALHTVGPRDPLDALAAAPHPLPLWHTPDDAACVRVSLRGSLDSLVLSAAAGSATWARGEHLLERLEFLDAPARAEGNRVKWVVRDVDWHAGFVA